MAPVTPIFAVPAKVTVTAEVVFAVRVKPPRVKVFPAPLAVSVLPVEALVIFTAPIPRVVLLPTKEIVLEELAVAVPVPRFRLFAAVFVADPKVRVSVHVQA
jgi:hypothetical protein